MHELSIANSLLEIAVEHARQGNIRKVTAVNLRIGVLACIHEDSLKFSFDLVAKDTILEGALLNVQRLPIIIYCGNCDREIEIEGIQQFRCPVCHAPASEFRQGRELEVASMEVEGQTLG